MIKSKYVRKLTKKGKYSYFIVLPKEIINQYRWQNRQKLIIKLHGKDKILISDWPEKK